MNIIHQYLLSLPGYGAPELKQGTIHAENDIYSFGRTFYVLRHHHFPEETQAPSTGLDKFLFKCCAENDKDRFHSIEEMEKALRQLMQSFPYRNMRKLLFGMSTFCILGALLFGQWHERNKEQTYADLRSTHQYTQAILYQSDDVRAYQDYVAYEIQERGEAGRCDAVKQILLLYETYPLEMKTEIARFLIQECIKSKDEHLYGEAVKLLKEKESMEEYIYLPFLSSKLTGMEREQYLAQVTTIIMAMDEEERFVQLELLIACYEYKPLVCGASFETLIDLYQLCKDNVKQQNLQYTYALWLGEEDPSSMNAYVTELEKQWHSPEQMRLLGNLYMDVFEETVPDEKKGRALHLLKKADGCFQQWKQRYPNDKSVDASLSQIQYLMEKWR